MLSSTWITNVSVNSGHLYDGNRTLKTQLPPTGACPLANTAQSTTWWLETRRSLVDDLHLHQVLQGVLWVLVFAASLGPGWLGRLHGPERNRDLQTNQRSEGTHTSEHTQAPLWVVLTLSCISASIASSAAMWLVKSQPGDSSTVCHGTWAEATRAATPTMPSVQPADRGGHQLLIAATVRKR